MSNNAPGPAEQAQSAVICPHCGMSVDDEEEACTFCDSLFEFALVALFEYLTGWCYDHNLPGACYVQCARCGVAHGEHTATRDCPRHVDLCNHGVYSEENCPACREAIMAFLDALYGVP